MPDLHQQGQNLSHHRIVDQQAAARAGCKPRTDHDSGPQYDGHDALFPAGWDDMDEDRYG